MNIPLKRRELCIGSTLAHDALDMAALDLPREWTAWVFDTRPVTATQLRNASLKFANVLLSKGIRPGDRVAIWLPNCFEWAAALYGCSRIGAIAVAMNTRWAREETEFSIAHCRPRLLLYRRQFLKIDYEAMIRTILSDNRARYEDMGILDLGAHSNQSPLWQEVFEAQSSDLPRVLPDAPQSPKDTLLLQYTSGSTAQPKGALINHSQVLFYGYEPAQRLGLEPGEYYLNAQPLYHVAGSCLALSLPLVSGVGVVMPEYYNAGRVIELLAQYKCAARGGTQTMYFDEIKHELFSKSDLSSLRAAWVGTSPEIMEKIRVGYGIAGLVGLYSATEGGGTFGDVRDPWDVRRDSVGRPLKGTDFKIRPLSGNETVEAGEVGEIGFSGWNTFNGYFDDEMATKNAIREDGYVYLGDLGYLDDAGYLHFSGRIKNMIKPGGENVASEEVEAYLLKHQNIRQVCVFGMQDARLGEKVVAVVELEPDYDLTMEDIRIFCASSIAKYKIPSDVYVCTSWPLSASGKIMKTKLLEMIANSQLRHLGSA